MLEVILKRFDEPDEIRKFAKGRFELVHMGGLTIGRATYEPGWKWSVHLGSSLGKKSCEVEHVGVVLSGRATAAMDDSWVMGEEPYVSLHLLGASHYAADEAPN